MTRILAAPAAAQSAARFDFVEYAGESQTAASDSYANPVLPGFHPDPSIVKVGDDFYMVTSTFSWFPGLPVLHSRDLVNWTQIGNAVDRSGMVDFADLSLTGDGLYAPAITYHDGTFYILNTCVRCEGNFLLTAADPAGSWSDPVLLDFGGIDPSLYVDEDGRGWITYNDAPAVEPRYEGHRAIWIREFDLASNQLLGEPILLVDGGFDPSTNPIWAEGPHIYKVDGWYYLLAAEGGTADQHSQTIYRSRNVTGPYAPGPVNPILTQRDLPADRPDRVEATGHADFVQLDDGSWWGVFLATRPFARQDTLMGRETFLLPVEWRDGWPIFLDQGEPVPMTAPRPNLSPSAGTDWSVWREDFNDGTLGHGWLRIRGINPVQDRMIADGALHLIPSAATLGDRTMPVFAGQRLRHHTASYTARVSFTPGAEGDFAGLAAVASETAFVALGIRGTGEGRTIALLNRDSATDPAGGEVAAAQPFSGYTAELRIAFDEGTADFAWRTPGGRWQMLAEDVDVTHMASVRSNLFTGVVAGPYAVRGGD
ncbi:glycoside hydrolase family 43 protein [Erythrobacter sp. EC-HK427]|uniref:glycoside hydrolase family 43 protein n=1 Tax=Erythrobacter sp. EC-HK427 TaxID=2038396 RepID=UPI0018FED969|nr:glycoside hydrolase family 43 protein [Erythrobacter sp. EC-HK427]